MNAIPVINAVSFKDFDFFYDPDDEGNLAIIIMPTYPLKEGLNTTLHLGTNACIAIINNYGDVDRFGICHIVDWVQMTCMEKDVHSIVVTDYCNCELASAIAYCLQALIEEDERKACNRFIWNNDYNPNYEVVKVIVNHILPLTERDKAYILYAICSRKEGKPCSRKLANERMMNDEIS